MSIGPTATALASSDNPSERPCRASEKVAIVQCLRGICRSCSLGTDRKSLVRWYHCLNGNLGHRLQHRQTASHFFDPSAWNLERNQKRCQEKHNRDDDGINNYQSCSLATNCVVLGGWNDCQEVASFGVVAPGTTFCQSFFRVWFGSSGGNDTLRTGWVSSRLSGDNVLGGSLHEFREALR